jgi:hypothetical protein
MHVSGNNNDVQLAPTGIVAMPVDSDTVMGDTSESNGMDMSSPASQPSLHPDVCFCLLCI